jgi:hypothetical protein
MSPDDGSCGSRGALLAGLLTAAGLLSLFPAAATTSRVDDTGTVVSDAVVPMRWKQLQPGLGVDHSVQASVRVAVRLNTLRWIHQPIRLYMALAPAAGSAPVDASWKTQGRWLPGSLRSGGRALVFEGVAGSALMEETLDLALRSDGRALVSLQSLQFYFEIDTP